MSTRIEKHQAHDEGGREIGPLLDSAEEAKELARDFDGYVLALIYEYEETELVADYRQEEN